MNVLRCALLALCIGGSGVFCDRIRDRIYHELPPQTFSSCFRRHNGTHEAGCQSSPTGNVGVLHPVRTLLDIQYVSEGGPHYPYIPVINVNDIQFYNIPTLRKLEQSKHVSGVILISLDNTTFTGSFSYDQTCPNEGSGLEDSCDRTSWNPVGHGMLFQKWDIPIFLLHNAAEINYLLDNCTFKFNTPRSNGTIPLWPLCSAELKSYMYAALNSETCMRRSSLQMNLHQDSRCGPLKGQNIVSHVRSTESINNCKMHGICPGRNSTIIIASRLDTASMFELSPGTQTAATGIITLLLVLEALSKSKEDFQAKRLLFVLFNGEAWDYIGSSRIVYDIQKGIFPNDMWDKLKFEHIDMFVELSQLGTFGEEKIFIHSDPGALKVNTTKQQIEALSAFFGEEGHKLALDVEFLNFTMALPPASLQSFLKVDRTIPGIIVADHKNQYNNRFYNSIYDTGANWNLSASSTHTLAMRLQKIAETVSHAVYRYATGNASTVQVNETLSETLVNCFANSSHCDYWSRFYGSVEDAEKYLPARPLDLYVGASGSSLASQVITMTMAELNGETSYVDQKLCVSQKDTENQTGVSNFWIFQVSDNSTGYCVLSPTYLSAAVSPAFSTDVYDFSGKYSTWTESIWVSPTVRVFLQPNPQDDINTLIFGLAITLVLTLVIFGLNRSARDIFHVINE